MIKRIGRYSIPVHVFEGVTAEVKTLVVPEGGELPPEEELAALEAAERAEAEAAEAAHARGASRDRGGARRGGRACSRRTSLEAPTRTPSAGRRRVALADEPAATDEPDAA